MEKLKEFLKGKPIWVKIVILISIGILVYFSSGCSLKADKVYFENPDMQLGIKRSLLWIQQSEAYQQD